MDKNYDYDSVMEDVTLCGDGVYRWRYDVNLLKDRSVFFLLLKILFGVFLAIFACAFLADALRFGLTPERVSYNLRFLGYIAIGIVSVSLLGYLIYAAIMGGKYCVIFEMDEQGINHMQIPQQARKARRISSAATAAGVAAGSFSSAIVGANAARTEMYSEFSKVRKIKANPRKNVIQLRGVLDRNLVFLSQKDYVYVLDFIKSHCRNLK